MVNQVSLKNYGPVSDLQWGGLGAINLVIGGNAVGKTFLLKAVYTAVRTLEEYRRGNDLRSAAEILAEKLYWTFQPEKIGDLVTKKSASALSFSAEIGGKPFSYGFGRDTTKQISLTKNDATPRQSNSVFLPAKEVLSLHSIILRSRETEKEFGFDDTYLDLARALRQTTTKGKNFAEFATSRQMLEEMLGGKIEFDDASNRWQFKVGNQSYPIGVTAEGIKKAAIIDTLLGNRYLDRESIVFIDEPESALHPSAVSKILDIFAALAENGMQFFLASHSYFVIKKLYLIALQRNIPVSILSADKGEWNVSDLKDGLPDNPIIEESIRLYREEMEAALS